MSTEEPGQVMVAFTERAAEQTEALARASGFAVPQALVPIEVTNTLKDLEATRAAVIADFDSLKVNSGVVSHYIDEPSNRVVVEVAQPWLARSTQLTNTYGEQQLLRFTAAGLDESTDIPPWSGGCRTFNTHCNPLRGGIALSTCTLGFKANAASNQYWITAGHCGNSQSHSGVNAGPVVKEANSGSLDAQIHSVGSGWSVANWIAESSGQASYPILAVERGFSMPNGVYLCFKGKYTAVQCAPIVNGNWWGVFDGIDRFNMLTISICPQTGESGGPVYAYNWAYAIALGRRTSSSGSCTWGIYTYVKNIEPWGGIEISVR